MKVNNDKNEKVTLYEMVMEFEVTLGLKELNNFMGLMGVADFIIRKKTDSYFMDKENAIA